MFDWHLFNYTDFNKINLDWVMDCLKALWGGSTDQILSKKSDNDFDFEWVNKPEVTPGTGLTEEIKHALLQLAQKVAYIDDQGQSYYQDLYDALYNEAPPVTLVSIDAVYTQSGTVYDTDTLNSLKADLVVTATYSDSTTAIIPAADYTLTGTLTVGSSVITVSYGGMSDTFAVTVTENPAPPVTLVSVEAVYTQSGTVYDTDTLDSLKADLVVTATYSDSSTAVIPSADYTLSGTLTVGTSTITVSYGGKTTTFTVTVSETILYPLKNGTHTFSDNSVLTITNGNHVKYECKVTKSSSGSNNPYFNISNIDALGTSVNDPNGINYQPTLFSLLNGSNVEYHIKNATASSGSFTIQSNMRIANLNSSYETSVEVTDTTASASKSVTPASDVNIGCAFVFFLKCSANVTYEFDVELYDDNVRYI